MTPQIDNLINDELLDQLALVFARAAVEQYLVEQREKLDSQESSVEVAVA